MPAASRRKSRSPMSSGQPDVRRLDEQVAGVAAEREPQQLLAGPVELGEVELAARHEPQRVADRVLHLGESRLHLVRCRRVVVAHVRRRSEHRRCRPRTQPGRSQRASSRSSAPSSRPGSDVRSGGRSKLREREEELARGARSRAGRTRRRGARSASGSASRAGRSPVMIVGMPLSASAGTIGSVPPERISAGRRPSARSNASSPSWIAFASGGTRPGGDDDHSSTSTSAPAGAASRSSRSTSGAISSTFWPGASRIDTFATASTGSTVFCRMRRAGLDAVHVERRLGERAQVELLAPRRVLRPRALLGRARRRPAAAASSRRAPRRSARRCPARSGSASVPSCATSPSSVLISACAAFSAAPP